MNSQSVKWLRSVAIIGSALAFALPPASAATAQANLSVSATVGSNCTIGTTPLAFGAYDPVTTHASSPLDGQGGVVVTCTTGADTTVTLGQGSHATGASTDAVPVRRLSNGGSSFLNYTLYSNNGRTTVWGNTSGTGFGHTGTGAQATLNVYGRIAAGQNVPAGSYTDTVVATITF